MRRWGSLEALERLEPGESDGERRPARRAAVEVLRGQLPWLDPEDRVLLKTYLEAGSSFDEIARLTGVNRSSVCRRVHRLIRRLQDETYLRCQADGVSFNPAELAVIRDHFVRGLSLKRISRDRRLGYYRVRAIVRKARACAAERSRMRSGLVDQRGQIRTASALAAALHRPQTARDGR
jgi:hypothetical protein